jgi:dTDP-4-dehydrorhamnose 3,5-epimerase-like enzyme
MIYKPNIINFDSRGSSDIGYLSICEELNTIPFAIKRVYWTYYTPQNITRGGHANIDKEMVLIAVAGKIVVTTEMAGRDAEVYVLENPNQGLYIPKLCWHTMQYSHNAVQMVIASNLYEEADYIRDYADFIKLMNA